MTGSKTWTEDEARSRFDALLEATKLTPQFISTSAGRFIIAFQKASDTRTDDFFSSPGPLLEGDTNRQ